MAETLYAHTPPKTDPKRWHDLDDHLRGVAELAAEFGDGFGASDLCRAIGMAHDLAKADARFQTYLRACQAGVRADTMPHAAPSAAAAGWLGPFVMLILAHHAGLYDKAEAISKLAEADKEAVAAAKGLAVQLGVPPIQPGVPTFASDELSTEMLLRMCFSALTDADFLDTEAHFNGAKSGERAHYPDIATYLSQLDAHLAKIAKKAKPTLVNQARAEILASCRAAAAWQPGAYRLEVPTGGGKTLSSLAFALSHAKAKGLSRVIYAVPYTSIIDQTARVYASIFGDDAILEHHSAYDAGEAGEGQTQAELRRKLAAENWDCPLVVTTTVQLFESLFARRTSRCRKLHRLAKSVIVLDEAQTLPPELLAPILDVLARLVAHYGSTVVFCTATQPDYSALNQPMLTNARQLVPDPGRYFEALRRVTYARIAEPISVQQAAALIDAEPQAMCVLNTRKDAVAVARACRQDDSLFHLSTLLCPAHRKDILREVRRRLNAGEPVRLVATQVIEAGVDVDFPKVMRVTGPLDRIVQAAGRCNREGKLPHPGECIVFDLQDGAAPRGWYKTGIELAATMVREDAATIDQPERVSEYFRDLYRLTNTNKRGIQELRKALAFEKVAEAFRMIPDDTVALAVPDFARVPVEELLRRPADARDVEWYRSIGQYSVGVACWQLRELQQQNLVTQKPGGYWVYTGVYDRLVGIGRGDEPDPADLIC